MEAKEVGAWMAMPSMSDTPQCVFWKKKGTDQITWNLRKKKYITRYQ